MDPRARNHHRPCPRAGALYAVLRERTRQLDTTARERDDARAERDARSRELADAQARISGFRSTHEAREKALEERRAEIDTHFKGLASEVLKSSSEEFRKQAAEQFKQQQELAGKDLKARETAVENLVKRSARAWTSCANTWTHPTRRASPTRRGSVRVSSS